MGNMRRCLPPAVLILLPCVLFCSSKDRKYDTARYEGISLVHNTEVFASCSVKVKPALTDRENGTDIPLEVAPRRWEFFLEDRLAPEARRKEARYYHPVRSSVLVVPLSDQAQRDFAKAYPVLAASARELALLLGKRTPLSGPRGKIPDFPNSIIAGHAIVSRLRYADYEWCEGIFFVTQYTQEEGGNPVNNGELACVFQGLSRDRAYYVSAHFAISHPSLPRGIDDTQHIARDRQNRYLKNAEDALNAYPPGSFTPSLQEIESLLASIRPGR